MTIVLLLLLLLAVEAFAAGIILRRLESRHAAVWAELGQLRAGEMTLSEKWLAMTKFIYGGGCLRLNDTPLNMLCATIVLGEIAILYAIIFESF